MKLRYPNRSVLSILTYDGLQPDAPNRIDQLQAAIFFVYVKSVPEYSTRKEIWWLHKKDDLTGPPELWKTYSVRHWMAFGSDVDINEVYDTLVSSRKITVDKYDLHLPATTEMLEAHHDPNVLDKEKREMLMLKDPGKIPSAFYREDNLSALSGYSGIRSPITPVNPPGFYEPGFLYNQLNQHIIGVRQHRHDSLQFRGIRSTNTDGQGSRQMIGFYQKNFSDEDRCKAILLTTQGEPAGEGAIDPASGVFRISANEPTKNGEMRIEGRNGLERAQRFVLLQNISGTVNASGNQYTDIYGKTTSFDRYKINRPTSLKPFSWYRLDFADVLKAEALLSEQFKAMLNFLGPEVLIADPYYLGSITKDSATGAIAHTLEQRAFLNAWKETVIMGSIKSLYFLGENHRANSQTDKPEDPLATKTEERFAGYKEMYLALKQDRKLAHFFRDTELSFRHSIRDFHNRYWFAVKRDNGVMSLDKCVSVSTSLSYMLEVDVTSIDNPDYCRQLVTRYMYLWNVAKSELEL